MFLSQGISKKQIARRLDLDIKTVRRALDNVQAPTRRASAPRPSLLDPWRDQIQTWLAQGPRLTAQRIGNLLRQQTGRDWSERTVRQFVARLRGQAAAPKPAFVLPHSNAIFTKAYPVERLECLMDGLAAAFSFFDGLTQRIVLDNTALAVKEVLKGPERVETELFAAFRGAWPVHADYCAPAKGWEKGSVEGAVKFVRNNCFRPIPQAESWDELNAALETECRRALSTRRLEDGRTVQEALAREREHLRPLPAHPPEACRVLTRTADKFGHVRVDRAHYSVPIAHAWRPVTVKVFHDRVTIAVKDQIVAVHVRSFQDGAKVLEPIHVLPLLEHKSRAAGEATALQQWQVPLALERLRQELRTHTRKPEREWIQVLRLLEKHPQEQVVAAVQEALERGSPRLETIQLILRSQRQTPPAPAERLELERADLAGIQIAPATLDALGGLWGSRP
jgi:transposase